jgi:redox-sensing transcriptional repressor
MPEMKPVISKHTLERLVRYLTYLKEMPDTVPANISATAIADALELNQVQVRKDLAYVGSGGRPRTGYVRKKLIRNIQQFLHYDNLTNAVIVGAGNLGKALMAYGNFTEYGLNIVVGFDTDPNVVGAQINNKRVLHISKMIDLCRRMHIHIGIITVPAPYAQDVCSLLIEGGVRAIWNFSLTHLVVPENVVVKNESLVASFTVLSKMLTRNVATYGLD